MKICVLMGSPRKNGNTAAIVGPFLDEMAKGGHEADVLEEGLKRFCKHSGLTFLGLHAERHLGYDTVFMDEEKDVRAREFARGA